MSDGAEAKNSENNPVTREDDYRRFAAQSLDLASRTSNLKDKTHLLAMTEAWLNLADRIARLAKRPKVSIGEHPGVSARLGREQREAD
jgi:hypothetical protein